MKITISFNEEEKRLANGLMHNIDDSIEMDTEDVHVAGSFGEFKYDSEENVIDIELKTGFIKAYTHLIVSFINLMKSFMSSCEIFASSWLLDIKDLTKKEEKEESNHEVAGEMTEH